MGSDGPSRFIKVRTESCRVCIKATKLTGGLCGVHVWDSMEVFMASSCLVSKGGVFRSRLTQDFLPAAYSSVKGDGPSTNCSAANGFDPRTVQFGPPAGPV